MFPCGFSEPFAALNSVETAIISGIINEPFIDQHLNAIVDDPTIVPYTH